MKSKGDKVVIRKDLEPNKFYSGVRTSPSMVKYANQTATIASVTEYDGSTIYNLNILGVDEGWFWGEEMFEKEDVNTETISAEQIKEGSTVLSGGCIMAGTLDASVINATKVDKFKLTDRVVITNLNGISIGEERKQYIGHTAIISEVDHDAVRTVDGVEYPYAVRFEDCKDQMVNIADGEWIFAESELEFTNKGFKGDGYKVVINFPAIVYLLDTDYGTVKGVAMKMKNDVWNIDRGVQIAKTKAQIKALKLQLKDLSK